MRGLEKNCTHWRRQTDRNTDTQIDGHGNSMPSGAELVKMVGVLILNTCSNLHIMCQNSVFNFHRSLFKHKEETEDDGISLPLPSVTAPH